MQVEWLLLAWFNAMLRQAGHARCIYNFGSDLCDMENYIVLLSYCFPEIFPMSILNHVNPLSRAERVINKGRRMGMGSRIRPSDIVESNVEANLAFICWVFDQYVDSNGGPFVTHEQQEVCGPCACPARVPCACPLRTRECAVHLLTVFRSGNSP